MKSRAYLIYNLGLTFVLLLCDEEAVGTMVQLPYYPREEGCS